MNTLRVSGWTGLNLDGAEMLAIIDFPDHHTKDRWGRTAATDKRVARAQSLRLLPNGKLKRSHHVGPSLSHVRELEALAAKLLTERNALREAMLVLKPMASNDMAGIISIALAAAPEITFPEKEEEEECAE